MSALLASSCAIASAAGLPFSPINLHHTAWTAKDGAPSNIIAIAQTPDSWMWLASQNGLYRFDGVRFEVFKTPKDETFGNDIWGMRVLSSGALWVGYRSGGVSVWHDGKLRRFGIEDGFPIASVLDFAEDWRGRVWASTSLGFRVFDGNKWNKPDESLSGRTGQCFLRTDSEKTIWARCEPGVFSLHKGEEKFGRSEHDIGFGRLSVGLDGTVWATGGKGAELLALSGPSKGRPLPSWPRPRAGGGGMLFERDGKHTWITRADGVLRFGEGESAKPFGISSGLSGDTPNCLYQDFEGNIWVGTENGLDRFRSMALSGVSITPTFWDTEAIAAGDNGALWVGGLEVKSPDYDSLAALPGQVEARAVGAIYRSGPDVWTGGTDGLWHIRDGKRERITVPGTTEPMQFQAITRDKDDGLWVAVRGAGALRLKDGKWQRGGGYKELTRRASWIMQDSRGRLWFGYMDNSIRVLEARKVKNYDAKDGLHAGTVEQIVESAKGVWIGGLNGLFHFDGKRFTQILGEGGDAFLGVSGLFMNGDSLWLNGAAGITVIAKADLDKAIGDAHQPVPFRRLDHKDGLRGRATNAFPLPSAVAGSDGTLWFATTAGLFWVDPKSTPRNAIPPVVYIRGANVDGAEYTFSGQTEVSFPANPGRVHIDYTALSLTMPERMRFRYRLEGVDRNWQEGDLARGATYTGLGPGDYVFRVKATNNEGVWSKSDGVLKISVDYAYYQTVWFRVLCAALLAGLLWFAHKLRVNHISRQVVVRTEARMQERERIARDLHDTLLQSVQALLLRMQSVLRRWPGDATSRKEIERSLDMVEAALEEGRDKVHDLRAAPRGELAADIEAMLLTEYPGLPLECVSIGDGSLLAPDAYEELRAISVEALRNAARHAGANRLSLEICYGDDALTMAIRDDGCGLPDAVQLEGRAAGRWGMVGMQERACRLGAELQIVTASGCGTELKIVLPKMRAYMTLVA